MTIRVSEMRQRALVLNISSGEIFEVSDGAWCLLTEMMKTGRTVRADQGSATSYEGFYQFLGTLFDLGILEFDG